MEAKTIALAYCIDNLHIAESIEQALRPTAYRFEHYYCKKNQSDDPLTDQLRDFSGPILLLISDNFLKSIHCMHRALQMIQQKSTQLLPVVVPGRKYNEQTGQVELIDTRFEKIGDIIPYINYWQNQYLDLRSQRKRIEADNDFDRDAFGDHLRILRQVSSEASEFLRILRNTHYVQLEQLTDDHFAALFQFLEDQEEWEAFRAKVPDLQLPALEEPTAPESPEPPAAEPVAEEETDEEGVDISAIPGLELLEGSENIAKIINRKMEEGNLNPVDEEELSTEEPGEDQDYGEMGPQVSTPNPSIEESPEPEEFPLREEEDSEDFDDPEDGIGERPQLPFENANDDEDRTPEEDDDPEPEGEHEPEADYFEDRHALSAEDQRLTDSDDPEEEDDDEENTVEEWADEQAESALVDPEGESESDKIDDIIQQSMDMLNNEHPEDALVYLNQATRRYPDSVELRYHYALLLAQNTDNLNAAIQEASTLLEIDPFNVDGNFLMGELTELSEDPANAVRYYKKVSELNPNYQGIYFRIGYVLANHVPERNEEAISFLQKACEQEPTRAEAHYQYALLLSAEKQATEEAMHHLKRTLDLAADHPFADYDLALIYYQQDNQEAAQHHYLRAISINPELQTPDNDAAFGVDQSRTEPSSEQRLVYSTPRDEAAMQSDNPETTYRQEDKQDLFGQDTIAALKNNIDRLEELLRERRENLSSVPDNSDKTVLISGATSGIGRAAANEFARHGYRVIINGRRTDRLDELKQEFFHEHGNDQVMILPFDVSKQEEVQHAIEQLPEEWQEIDILVNNAGKAKGLAPIHEGELQHWEEMIDVNIKGLLYLTRAITPGMVRRRSGHVINVGSIAGKEAYPKGNVYCATKFAVEALTKSMRMDLHEYGIRVSQVSPGHVKETEFALVRFDGDRQKAKIYNDFNPVTSQDVAEVIYFMASRPAHVNVQDVLMMGTQQASATMIDRSGRYEDE